MDISLEVDREVRKYIKCLDKDWGEDAYHDAVVSIISNKERDIYSPIGYLTRAAKHALYHIWRHESAEGRNIESFVHNSPIPMQVGLVNGRLKHLKCKKNLHDLVEENIVYIKGKRNCRLCKQKRERDWKKKRYWDKKALI